MVPAPAPAFSKGFNCRLLTTVIDERAAHDPQKCFMSIPAERSATGGQRDISYAVMAEVIKRCAWWIEETFGGQRVDFQSVATYIPAMDFRDSIMALRAIKAGFQMIFSSPRNRPDVHIDLPEKLKCKILFEPDLESDMDMAKSVLERRSMEIYILPSLDFPHADKYVKPHPYNKTFYTARKDPHVVIHSSDATGTPKNISFERPRLSRRYYTVDLPVDLPDSIMIRPVEHFEAARAKLDEAGWSGDVMVHPVSCLRAILLLSIIRKEVMELLLGPPMPNIALQARQILSNLTSTWGSIPHKQYESSMCGTMIPMAIWVVIGPQLECLYTEFLLSKMLISQNEGSRDKMTRTPHEILQLVLSLLKKNDVIATPNMEGMMVFPPMQCASVLTKEPFDRIGSFNGLQPSIARF